MKKIVYVKFLWLYSRAGYQGILWMYEKLINTAVKGKKAVCVCEILVASQPCWLSGNSEDVREFNKHSSHG